MPCLWRIPSSPLWGLLLWCSKVLLSFICWFIRPSSLSCTSFSHSNSQFHIIEVNRQKILLNNWLVQNHACLCMQFWKMKGAINVHVGLPILLLKVPNFTRQFLKVCRCPTSHKNFPKCRITLVWTTRKCSFWLDLPKGQGWLFVECPQSYSFRFHCRDDLRMKRSWLVRMDTRRKCFRFNFTIIWSESLSIWWCWFETFPSTCTLNSNTF